MNKTHPTEESTEDRGEEILEVFQEAAQVGAPSRRSTDENKDAWETDILIMHFEKVLFGTKAPRVSRGEQYYRRFAYDAAVDRNKSEGV